MHQGLLGIGDYANLSFIQEKSTWLIRLIQVINLPIIILFLSKKIKNNIFLISFLSIPTFIQWSTIGKPLFLGESSLILIYLIWKDSKTLFSLQLLIISILNCIAFKLSSLIIISPIVLHLLLNYSNNYKFKKKFHIFFKYVILNKGFLISSLIIISLLISRIYITGNFAYPLLTNIFNSEEKLVSDFADMLREYKRENFFFLRIFIPANIPDLSQSLGPSIMILSASIFYKNLISSKFFSNSIINVIILQFILLILFCQGRADYYCAPLILLFSEANKVEEILCSSRIKYLFNISIIFQIIIINLFLSFSILTNFLTAINYTNYMNKFAYGFNNSGLIDKSMEGKFLVNDRNTRLYYPANYLDIDKMKTCVIDYKNLGEIKAKEFCLRKYNVTQILNAWEEKLFNTEEYYECEIKSSLKATRNIFNSRKYSLNYCKLKNLPK